jgi:DNA-directed RNA polymerase subunit N (RpoN/RPB10)
VIIRGHDGEAVYTVRCSLCGKRKGDGWLSFSDHVYADHGPEDAGLSPLGEREEAKPEPVPA